MFRTGLRQLFIACLASLLGTVGAVTKLELNCTLDPDSHKMHVVVDTDVQPEWIKAGQVSFRLAKAMTKPKVFLLQGGSRDAVEVESKAGGNQIAYTVRLSSGLPTSSKLDIEYDNAANDGFVFHVGPEGTFAGGYNTTWYPTFGDTPSVGRMTFSVPQGYVVKASGKQADGRNVFDVSKPTVLTFAAARYVVKRIGGKVPITLYLLRHRPNEDDYAKGCWKILGVLQKAFGRYPQPDFSIIETPSPISIQDGFSGASFEGFMFGDSDSLDAPFDLAYFAHEMSHQWWGNLVHEKGPGGGDMLSEGLAQYGSLIAVTAIDGSAAARLYRSTGYPGYSMTQCGHGAVMDSATKFDAAFGSSFPGMPFAHEFACAKGFLAWDAIARKMGRNNFHRALRSIAAKYGYSRVRFRDFLQTLKAFSPIDSQPDIDQWLYRKGLPCLSLEWSLVGHRCTVTIDQTSPAYRLDVPIEVVLDGGRRIRRVLAIDSTQARFNFDVSGDVRSVILDPDFEVLHTTPALNREAEGRKYATQAFLLILEGRNDEAKSQCELGLANLPNPDPYGAKFELLYTLGGLDRRAQRFDAAKLSYQAALACPVRNRRELPYVYLWLATIAKSSHDESALRAALEGLESTDGSLDVPSGARRIAVSQGLLR